MSDVLPPLPVKSGSTDLLNPSAPESNNLKHQPKKTPLALVVLLAVLILAGITTPIVIVALSNRNATERAKDPVVRIDTKNEEVKAAIEQQFVYSGASKGAYYSPTLDISFTVDRNLLDISENSGWVNISEKGNYDRYASLELISTELPMQEFLKNAYNFYDKLVVGEPEAKGDGSNQIVITYESKPLNKAEKAQESIVVVLYRTDVDKKKTALLKIRETGRTDVFPAEVISTYLGILDTVVIAPQNVSDKITAQIKEVGLELAFDKKKWSVTSQTSSSISLSYQSASSKPYIYVYTNGYASKVASAETQSKSIDDDIAVAKTTYSQFKITEPKREVQLNGAKAYTYSSSYIFAGWETRKTSYRGYIEGKVYFSFDISYNAQVGKMDATYAAEDIKAITDSLKVSAEQIQARTNTGLPRNVLGASTISIEKPALLGKLATVHIMNIVCTRPTFNDSTYLPKLSSTTFQKGCFGGYGSGFFVNQEGYLVTNAHVVDTNAYNQVADSLYSTSGSLFKAIATELYPSILAMAPDIMTKPDANAQYTAYVRGYILKAILDKKISFVNTDTKIYMETDTPFDFDKTKYDVKDPSKYVPLEVVKTNYLTSYIEYVAGLMKEGKPLASNPYVIAVPDLAILRVKTASGTKYPTLSLANADLLTAGSSLLAIGFPGVADQRDVFAASSSKTATITKGIVSAIKSSAKDNFNLVQTDASINHGNSGGPMIDNDANVIAVSTYGIDTSTGNVNAGVSVAEVKKMLSEQKISTSNSEITEMVLSGIDNLQKSYTVWALRDFNAVIAKYPISSDIISPLKSLAQEKIDAGEDNTPITKIGNVYIHKKDLPYLIGGLGVGIVALLILVMMLFRKKKKVTPVTTFTPPQQPMAPMPEMPQAPMQPVTMMPVAPVSQPQMPTIPQEMGTGMIQGQNPMMQPPVAEFMPPAQTMPEPPMSMPTQPMPTVPVMPLQPPVAPPWAEPMPTSPVQSAPSWVEPAPIKTPPSALSFQMPIAEPPAMQPQQGAMPGQPPVSTPTFVSGT